jgi:transcription antitermination factor NusG
MAFAVGTKVRVADESSEYRGHRGEITSVNGERHRVRLDQHGCATNTLLRTDQLQEDLTAHQTDYTQC